MYVLNGNGKDLENVIKEQRIRIQMGLISITPIEEAGLASQEDLENLRAQNEEKCKEIEGLRAQITEKCARVENLEKEVEYYKNQIPTDKAEDAHADTKKPPVEDTKSAPAEDSKSEKKGK